MGDKSPKILSGQPLQALSHYIYFSVSHRQQGAESDCATPYYQFPPDFSSQRGLRPLPRPWTSGPTLPFLGLVLFPVNPVQPQGS